MLVEVWSVTPTAIVRVQMKHVAFANVDEKTD